MLSTLIIKYKIHVFLDVNSILYCLFAIYTLLILLFVLSVFPFRNLVTALWLFCAALGTLINAAVAEIPIPAKYMFFAYACAMTVVVVIFILVNRRYQYRNATNLPQSREFNNTDKNVNATNGST